jgi:membrane dipeptidase
MRRIIDSHLDLSWNAVSWDRDLLLPVSEINLLERGMEDDKARGRATTSLPEMRRGGIHLCLATILTRTRAEARRPAGPRRVDLDQGTLDAAYALARGQLEYYRLLEERGELRSIRTAEDLGAHWESWRPGGEGPIGFVLAMEGADPILEPERAKAWWDLGLRSVNLVHYGRNRYASGTGDSGPVTPLGIELLREMERLGMILDVTHLSDESFFDALEHFGGPLLASHQNCRALVPGVRQFSDEQLRLLIERDGVIGAALDAWMLYPDWRIGKTSREVVGLEAVADHIDHVSQLAGSARHAAIGSDLDGGFGSEQVPMGLESIADLQKLEGILAARGYRDEDITAVFHGNWLRFLGSHLPRAGAPAAGS